MFFGAQYYRPPFPGRSDWERDFDHMARLGFNAVKLWAVWNWIEPRRGEQDFGDLDELVALARRKGLAVVLNTIPEGAPPWTLEGNEDALYVTKSGERIGYGGPANLPSAGWPGLCCDKPEALALVSGFVETVAARYRSEETVVALDVWNEPHLEPMFDYRSDMLCYCAHSAAEFRRWLAARYGDIGALNEIWFRRYASWDEILPPPRFGTWTDMMDWRLFWIENLARWLRARVEAARRGAPGKAVQTHVAYSAYLGNKLAGGLANEVGDEFSLAREVDLFGLSSFPKWLQGERHPFVQLAHAEAVAEAARGKRFYQVELQGGGGKAGLLGGEVPDARDVELWNYNSVAAGGKGVLYWQFAAEPAGLESPGFGLVGFRGEDTERSRAAAACARSLDLDFLDRARRVLPVNGVYLSRRSETLCFCAERRDDLYAASVAGAYKAAYLESVPIRFVHEDYVERILEEGLRTLYLPMALCLTGREREALASFAEAGGTLVAEAGIGLYDGSGLLDPECLALRDLFGLAHVELQAQPGWGFAKAEPSGFLPAFSGKQYRQVVEPLAGVSVLARFGDGAPAATERALGSGRAVFLATFAGLAFHELEDEATRRVVAGRFDPRGYRQVARLEVEPRPEPPFAPVLRLHETDDELVLVASNHRREDTRLSVGFAPGAAEEDEVELTVPASRGLVRRVRKAQGAPRPG